MKSLSLLIKSWPILKFFEGKQTDRGKIYSLDLLIQGNEKKLFKRMCKIGENAENKFQYSTYQETELVNSKKNLSKYFTLCKMTKF